MVVMNSRHVLTVSARYRGPVKWKRLRGSAAYALVCASHTPTEPVKVNHVGSPQSSIPTMTVLLWVENKGGSQ
uniref:Uncharacterized protein n=1 Tax=Steinernema glaseri TaxID=37863 RepID=A0A1I7Y034_9BILA